MQRYWQFTSYRSQLAPLSGAMGYGVPASLAGKLVHPERQVIAFAGDGCFLMCGQELATMVANDLAILVIVVNNGMLGTIRMHQERNYPGRVIGDRSRQSRLRRVRAQLRRLRRARREHRGVRPGARARARQRRPCAARARVRPGGADAAPVALGRARPGREERGALSGEALHALPARRIAAAVTAGELSAEEVTRHHLARIEEHAHLNTVITLTREQALARAKENPTGPLAGVPLLVKDVFDTAGVRTTQGSRIFRENVPLRSATSVRRLLDAGAIMLGKANLHEFAWGVTSRNRAYGAVVNSARPDRIPGGSSGGNASALAAGLCALGLGTDTGASIRLPAAACGVAGLKPAFGSVPADGLWPLAPSFDHVGPLARSFDDCVLAFGVLRGAPLAERDPAGLRVRQLDCRGSSTRRRRRSSRRRACPRRPRSCDCTWPRRPRCTARSTRSTATTTTTTSTPRWRWGSRCRQAERAELVNALGAWRAACASECDWDVLVSPVYPGDLPSPTCP